MSAIVEQCDLKTKHPEHEWYKGPFRRQCKGRTRAVK